MPDIDNWTPAGLAPASSTSTATEEKRGWDVDSWTPADQQGLSPQEDVAQAHAAGLSVGRTPEEHAAYLKGKGYKEEAVKNLTQQYKLDYTKQNLGRFPGQKETVLGSVGRQFVEHGVPFRSLFVNEQKDAAEAQKRFAEGKATDKDITTIARAQRRAEEDQGLVKAGAIPETIGALRAAPAIIGEFLTGGAIASKLGSTGTLFGRGLSTHAGRMAVVTAAAPSMYMDVARQKNIENGRPADSWEGLPSAALHAYAQMLVLGRVFGAAGEAAPTGLRAGAVNALKGGAQGAVEMGLADTATNFADLFVPQAYKISTGYGTFEKLMTGDVSGAARKFGTDTLTLAAFAGMHRLADGLTPEQAAKTAHDVAEVTAKDLQVYRGRGLSEKAAFEKVGAFNDRMKDRVRMDPNAAQNLSDYIHRRMKGESAEEAYKQAFRSEPAAPKSGEAALDPSRPQLQAPETPTKPSSEPTPPPAEGPSTPEIVQPAKPAEAVAEPERYYRVPDYKGEAKGGVDAAIRELVGNQFSGKWFSRGRTQNESYFGPERVQFEFRSDRLGSEHDVVDLRAKEVGIGSKAPMYMHPALSSVRYRGKAESEGYKKLESLIKDVNSERVKANLDPIHIEATDSVLPREAKTQETKAEPPVQRLKSDVGARPVEKLTPKDQAAELLDLRKQGLANPKSPAIRPKAVEAVLRSLVDRYTPKEIAAISKQFTGKAGKTLEESLRNIHRDIVGSRVAMAGALEHKDILAEFEQHGYSEFNPDVLKGTKAEATKPAEEKLTTAQARDYWKSLSESDRADLKESSPALHGQLMAAMERGGINPAKVASVKPEQTQRGDEVPLDPAIEAHIDAAPLSAERKAGVKALMGGASTRAAAKVAGVSHEKVRQDAAELFGESAVNVVEGQAQQRGRERKEATEAQTGAESFTGQGRTTGGGRRKSKSFLKNFLEREGGYLDLERLKELFAKLLTKPGEWYAWLKSGAPANGPGVKLDNKNPLPRPQNWEDYKRVTSEAQGVGRVPFLKWLFDPGRSDTTPEGKAFVGHQAMKETGKDVAALWALMEKAADKLFGTGEGGTYLRGDGSKGRMADDIEAEMRGEKTKLSAEQKAWVKDVWTPLLRDAQKMMRENGINTWVNEEGEPLTAEAKAYFPRQAVGKIGVEGGAGTGGAASPGAKAHFQKARRFKTEAEGAETIIYDPSAKSRVAKFISGVYRVIADHKLANDAALQGKTPTERYNTLFAENAERLKGLSKDAQADLLAELKERANNPVFMKESFVHSGPAFAGKIFPKEIADKIEKQFQQESADWIKNIERVSAAAKGVMLGGDASFTTIQLLPLLFRNPKAWSKAMGQSIRSIWNPSQMADYLSRPENAEAARQLVQLGSSVGRLQDFMRGLQSGEFATKIPGLGKAYEAAGRAFGTAMDVAKVELWKSWSKIAQPHELRNVAEAIDSMLLTGRMEGIGLSPQRMMAERLMLLASSYYRGGANLIATAFQRGTPGLLARQALGATISGVLIATVGAMKAVGLSDDEIEERLNPARGKFLKVPVELGDGKKIEVGTSNILTSYVRLLGMGADHFSSDKPINTGTDGNPILRWLRGKAAFAPRLSIDIVTGKDYFGNRIEPQEAVVKSFEPLLLQQILHGEGGVFEKGVFDPNQPNRANIADALVSIFGLSSYPGSNADAHFAALNAEAREKFGKDYDRLSINQQSLVVKSAAKRPDMPPKPPATPQQMERAMSLQVERQGRITKMMSNENQEKLTALAKQLPAYQGTLAINGEDVPLGKDRMKRFEELLAEEYNKTVDKWQVAQIKTRPPESREDYLRSTLTAAKERAKQRLIRESR